MKGSLHLLSTQQHFYTADTAEHCRTLLTSHLSRALAAASRSACSEARPPPGKHSWRNASSRLQQCNRTTCAQQRPSPSKYVVQVVLVSVRLQQSPLWCMLYICSKSREHSMLVASQLNMQHMLASSLGKHAVLAS
jgi:hypothetical protein